MTNPPDAANDSLLRRYRADFGVALLLLASSVLFMGSLWIGGAWYASHELFHPVFRLFELDAALRGGQFPVRWCDNLMGGFGVPFFNFYAPLSFYAAEPFRLLGLTLDAAMKLEMTLACWAGGGGMYVFLRGHTGRFGAAVGAVLYLFAPYHVLTVYVRGNPPEFTALCVWPWVFWAAQAVVRSGRRWRGAAMPLGAIALAALVASHVLTAYMAAINLVAWALFLIVRREQNGASIDATRASEKPAEIQPTGNDRHAGMSAIPLIRRAGPLAGLAFFGAALSAFFWLPAFADLRYTAHEVLYQAIRYEDHFVYPQQFFSPAWGFGLSLPGPEDGMSFQLGVALWLGVVAAVVLWVRRGLGAERPLVIFSLVLLAIHLVAMMPVSTAAWRVLPGAKYLQFPWRLLIPAAFWAAVIGGLAAARIFAALGFSTAPRRVLGAIVLALPAALSAPYLHPLLFDPAIPPYSPRLVRLMMTDTAAHEYIPIWVDRLPERPAEGRIVWTSAKGTDRLIDHGSAWYRFEVDATQPGGAAMDVFWFPGWGAQVDGEPVETQPVTPYGLVGWEMPQGKHDVVVRFGETGLRRWADWISLTASALAILWMLVAALHREPRCQEG